MRAALWTKLKAAGPVLTFEKEFKRFNPWLPANLQPLIKLFWHWYTKLSRQPVVQSPRTENTVLLDQVIERLEREKKALVELNRCAAELRQYPLLTQFIDHLIDAQKQSQDARQKSLAGQKINPDFDDQLIAELLLWLNGFRHSKQRELATWLARLLSAWWQERTMDSNF